MQEPQIDVWIFKSDFHHIPFRFIDRVPSTALQVITIVGKLENNQYAIAKSIGSDVHIAHSQFP